MQGTVPHQRGSDGAHVSQAESIACDQMDVSGSGEGQAAVGSKVRAHRPTVDRPVKACFISPLGYGLYRPESGIVFGGAEVQFFLLSRALAADPAFNIFVLTTVDDRPRVEQCGSLTVVRRRGRKRLSVKPDPNGFGTLGVSRGYVTAFLDMWRTLRAIGADCYLHAGAGVDTRTNALVRAGRRAA